MEIYFNNDFIKDNETFFYAVVVCIVIMIIICFTLAVISLKKYKK